MSFVAIAYLLIAMQMAVVAAKVAAAGAAVALVAGLGHAWLNRR
jgi:hypothetical protein